MTPFFFTKSAKQRDKNFVKKRVFFEFKKIKIRKEKNTKQKK